MGVADCHVIQSKCLRLYRTPGTIRGVRTHTHAHTQPYTHIYVYIPEIISVFLHIDYSANFVGETTATWRGRVSTTRKVCIRRSPSTLFFYIFPSSTFFSFFFFRCMCTNIYREHFSTGETRFFFHTHTYPHHSFRTRVPADRVQ